MRIAINGAGIAGTALAFWLQRARHEVLLIEEAPRLRTGGYIVDFWGIGYDVAEKMALAARICERGYQVQEVRFVDERGTRVGGFDVDALRASTQGRFTSVKRSDIAAVIYEALEGKVETLFGDSIASIDEQPASVRVGFDHAASREVDLVIGADGLHSRVRRLCFGAGAEREVLLGYHVAAFEAQGYRPRDELVYLMHSVPGRQVSRFAMRGDATLFLFVFRDEYLSMQAPHGDDQKKAVLKHAFDDAGWECPQILGALERAHELYFDRVSQIRLPRWSQGRVALIGDAAACVSLLAGEGTGLAIAEAYVLAGELQWARGDHHAAFTRYEERLHSLLEDKQARAARFASSFAPKTAAGITLRNWATQLMNVSLLAKWLIGRQLSDDVTLPDYEL
ncbi:MAG TPA: FAD-binding domain [Caldimonas sp.]|nr:FAD-binding domain [Caldimonas sp.]